MTKYYLLIKDATWTVESEACKIMGYESIWNNLLTILHYNEHTTANKIYLNIAEIDNEKETLNKSFIFDNIEEAKKKIKSWIIFQ